MPHQKDYEQFSDLVSTLYADHPQRQKGGNDPVLQFLEGCYYLKKDDKVVGRFAFYENPELKYQSESAATIGSYECIDDEETSSVLIEHAKRIALEKGYQKLLGPMEGSTWNNYRFSNHNKHDNFMMEPYHHIYYNQQFKNGGFEVVADYFSNFSADLETDQKKLEEQRKFIEEQGCTVRYLDMDDFENELERIGVLSIDGFSDNFLYTPIQSSEFVSKYGRLKDYFLPELIQIVENEKKEIEAFVFAIEDFLCANRKRMIIKSLVKRKGTKVKGLGSFLTRNVSNTAQNIGFQEVIHALMIKDNQSLNISLDNDGDAYKSYSLYGMSL